MDQISTQFRHRFQMKKWIDQILMSKTDQSLVNCSGGHRKNRWKYGWFDFPGCSLHYYLVCYSKCTSESVNTKLRYYHEQKFLLKMKTFFNFVHEISAFQFVPLFLVRKNLRAENVREWCPKQHVKIPAPPCVFFKIGVDPPEWIANISFNMLFFETSFK